MENIADDCLGHMLMHPDKFSRSKREGGLWQVVPCAVGTISACTLLHCTGWRHWSSQRRQIIADQLAQARTCGAGTTATVIITQLSMWYEAVGLLEQQHTHTGGARRPPYPQLKPSRSGMWPHLHVRCVDVWLPGHRLVTLLV